MISQGLWERVVRLKKLDGSELGEKETYTLTTSNYRATGTGGYECIGRCRSVGSYADEMPDLLIRYLKSHSPVRIPKNSRMIVRIIC